jgi:predicted nucleic acid-binding protein
VIAYFDTSAVVPLLIAEAGSERAASLWNDADRVVSVRLLYPETRAALAQAERLGRISARNLRATVEQLGTVLAEIDIVEVDEALAHRAGELAEAYQLRGYDAVHLAAAERLRDPSVVLVAGDAALLEAGTIAGIAIAGLP